VKREANSFPNTSCAVPVTRRKREAPERRPKNAIVEQIGAALGCVLIWFFALLCLVGSRKFNERPLSVPNRDLAVGATQLSGIRADEPRLTGTSDERNGDSATVTESDAGDENI
jgi:hypothetical protein